MDRALRQGQAGGPSAAATCLTFKTPPAASLYAGIPQILFFWIYKIQSPSLYFGIFRTMRAQHKMANANIQADSQKLLILYKYSSFRIHPSNNFAENPRKFPGIFTGNPRKFPGIFHGKTGENVDSFSLEFLVTHSEKPGPRNFL